MERGEIRFTQQLWYSVFDGVAEGWLFRIFGCTHPLVTSSSILYHAPSPPLPSEWTVWAAEHRPPLSVLCCLANFSPSGLKWKERNKATVQSTALSKAVHIFDPLIRYQEEAGCICSVIDQNLRYLIDFCHSSDFGQKKWVSPTCFLWC